MQRPIRFFFFHENFPRTIIFTTDYSKLRKIVVGVANIPPRPRIDHTRPWLSTLLAEWPDNGRRSQRGSFPS